MGIANISFFLTKPAKQARTKKSAPLIAGKPSNAKQSAETLNRLGCAACALNRAPVTTPKMKPTLAENTLIYFLGETPGEEDDEQSGRPLTGPGGRLIRSCIPSDLLGFCSWDNAVRDRTPESRTPIWSEIECCKNYIIGSIEQAKPKLIVGLGAIPLQMILGSSDLSGMRGRVFSILVGKHICSFIPTYHPDYILKTAFNKKKPLNSRLGHALRMDLKKALAHATQIRNAPEDPAVSDITTIRDGVQSYPGTGDYDELLSLIVEAGTAKVVAVDIETYPLRPYALGSRLLTVALSYEKEKGGAVNFSFALDHPKAGWSTSQKATILDYLKALLTNQHVIKIAHNAPFEIEWFIWKFGKGIARHDQWECTQMQAHFLDERRGAGHGKDDESRRAAYQSLDFLVKQYFGFTYKHLFKLNKKQMDQADLAETLVYNAVDTKVTLALWHKQTALLAAQSLTAAYKTALPRQTSVALMQSLGMLVDQPTVIKFQEKLRQEIAEIEHDIKELAVVKAYIRDKGNFNPLGEDAICIFRDYLKRSEIEVKIEVREGARLRWSVDKNVLDKIDHPLANMIVQLRNKSKLKNTYVDTHRVGTTDSVCWPDLHIHPNFNTTFSETGRTSSDSPNAQNYSNRVDSWVRAQIVAPKDHLIVAFDYGQLEACTAAMCSRDSYLVKALWDNYDMHMEWAKRIHAVYPQACPNFEADPKAAKAFRNLVKGGMVFASFFGAGADKVSQTVGIPLEIAEKMLKEFWSTFSGYDAWQKDLLKRYYETGYVISPTGRRHGCPLTKNQVMNFPIQSFACDIVCSAMDELSRTALETGLWYLHPRLNIHDDLTLIVPDSPKILDETVEIIYKTMLSPPWKSIVNVPLSVKGSVGKNWHEMEEIGQFWSHKDL